MTSADLDLVAEDDGDGDNDDGEDAVDEAYIEGIQLLVDFRCDIFIA